MMEINQVRDHITIEMENGQEKQFAVEALFDMEDSSYALLSAGEDDMMLMRIEDEGDEQYLVGIENEEEIDAIITAYELAIEEDLDDEGIRH